MKFTLLNPLSLRGSRFERGSIVELTDDELKAIDPTDIAQAVEVEPTAEVDAPADADEETTEDKPKRGARKAK